MDNEQKEVLKNLIEKNKIQIDALNGLISNLKSTDKDFKKIEKEFYKFFQAFEDSHSKFFFSPYNNYYHVENKNFTKSFEPFIIDAVSGYLNQNFIGVPPQYFSNLEIDWENKISKYSEEVEETLEDLKFILSDIRSDNLITKSLDNVNQILNEINEVEKVLEYPRFLSEERYAIKGEQMFPYFMDRMQPVMLNAPHRIIVIKLEHIFQTRGSLLPKLLKIVELLKSINNLLPFSKIISQKENGININLSQNQHGELNHEKYQNYGSAGAVGRDNEVKSSTFNQDKN